MTSNGSWRWPRTSSTAAKRCAMGFPWRESTARSSWFSTWNTTKVVRAEVTGGLPVKELIRQGEPIGVIRKVVEEERIDLLLMPAHEESRLEHLLFGRINDALIRRLPCSILLVKQEPGT